MARQGDEKMTRVEEKSQDDESSRGEGTSPDDKERGRARMTERGRARMPRAQGEGTSQDDEKSNKSWTTKVERNEKERREHLPHVSAAFPPTHSLTLPPPKLPKGPEDACGTCQKPPSPVG